MRASRAEQLAELSTGLAAQCMAACHAARGMGRPAVKAK